MPLLDVANLTVGYGSLGVLKNITITVAEGEIVTILGSNGAGKTTALRTVAGLLSPSAGRITFDQRDIVELPAHAISALGLALVPEGRQLFPQHTVLENLELGAFRRLRRGLRNDFNNDLAWIFDLFPRLRERLAQSAGLLSGGEQQMVAIARALVGRPRLLLLDEPSLGLAPLLVQSIFDTFVKLRERGITILLVEQMATLALQVCDRAYVLESGVITLTGSRSEVAADPRVLEAYLGKSVGHGAGLR
jgi:branched-chain amino acid transport system ATP-binding protein